MTRIPVHLGHNVVFVEFDQWTLISNVLQIPLTFKILTAKLVVTNHGSKPNIA